MANQFKFEIPGSVKPTAAYPTDYYYGPWTSTTEALSATTGTRYVGQTVCVITGGVAHKYIFLSGTTNSDLILESTGSIDDAFLSLSGGAVSGDTSFNGNLSATTYYSGATLLDTLFATHGDLSNKADLSGAEFSGGIFAPIVSAATYYSGSTLLETVINSLATGSTSAGSGLEKTSSTGSTAAVLELGGEINKNTALTGNIYNFDISSKLNLNNTYGFNYSGVGFNSTVNTLIHQSDGKILVGGSFTAFNGTSFGRITRLNVDGSIDATFNSGGTGFDNAIHKIVLQSDGKILVGGQTPSGAFTTYNGIDVPDKLVRLNSDGSYDTSFNSGGAGFPSNNSISYIEVQSDGKIIVAGFFDTYNGTDYQDNILRLNTDGSVDTTFNSGGTGFNSASTNLVTIAIQSDGKILVGGVFTSYNGISNSTRLLRLNSDGSYDTSFNSGGTGFNNFVRKVIVQPDGKIIVAGFFTTFNGSNCPDMLVRLNADGYIDNTFNNGGSGIGGANLQWAFLQPDNKILAAGTFTTYNGINCPDNLIRVNSDGSLDTSFNSGGTGFTGALSVVDVQSDGKIIVGGSFTVYNGTSFGRIIRLKSDGSIDTNTTSVLLNGDGGLRYAANYHDQYTDRTLVDQAYVLSVATGSYIPLSGNTTAITGNLIFEEGNLGLASTDGLSLVQVANGYAGINTENAGVYVGDGNVNMFTAEEIGLYSETYVELSGEQEVRITTSSPAGFSSGYFNSDGIELNAGSIGSLRINSKGSPGVYASMSTSALTEDRTIVWQDKDYTGVVDLSDLDGLSVSASNGITKTGSTVELGGIFTHDTVLTGDTYNFDVYSKLSLNNKSGGFNIGGTGFNNTVNTVVALSDGSILVGGDFTTYNGTDCQDRLVRLSTDGTIDATFNPGGTGFNSVVNSLVLQSDGSILAGGDFTAYNGVSCPRGLVRLNSDGTIDSTFNSGGAGFSNSIYSIKVQSDGSILAGGYFFTYNGVNCPDMLVRLNSGGTIDSTFNLSGTGFNSDVKQLHVQSDGKIIVGGAFTTFNGINCSDFLVRLTTGGTLDTSFNTGGVGFNNNFVISLKSQSDGKLLVCGNFTTYNGVSCPDRLVRLNDDGTIDTAFNSGGAGFADNIVFDVLIQPDGKILVCGNFTAYNGINTNGIIRLNSNGTIDSTFIISGTGFNSVTRSLDLQSDGKILVGGSFTTYNSTPANRIIRLNLDGSIDTYTNKKVLLNGSGLLRHEEKYHKYYTNRSLVDKEYVDNNLFASNGLSIIDRAAELGGTLTKNTIINGNYNLSFGNTSNEINNLDVYSKISLNNKRSIFNTGGTGFNNTVYAAVTQLDGKILVGGFFTTYNGVNCPDYLVRLTTGGTIDSTFNLTGAGFNNVVYAIDLQSDGKILAGGNFTTYNGANCPDKLVRLTTGGTHDTTFNTGGVGFNNTVLSVKVQSDGSVLVGGYFTTYNSVTCPSYFVKLTTGGTIDATFNSGGTGFNSDVQTLALQSDGKILAGGNFTTYNGANCPDYLVRLTTGGTIDSTFNSGGTGFSGGSVLSTKVQSDGKIIVGGRFTTYNGVNCPDRLVRLNSDGTIDSTFNPGGTGFNSDVKQIHIQSDGSILAGGDLTTYNGVSCPRGLVRLTTGGTIDSTFNVGGTGFDDIVNSLYLQSDGKIVVGGLFTKYNGVNCPDRLIRLNSNGSIDSNNVKVLLDGAGALRYESRYHDEYTDRTLVDREYVLSAIATLTGGSSSTGNFLSLSGGTVTGNTNFSANLSAATLYSGSTLLDSLFARTVHSHVISDVTGLQTQLNNKADLSGTTAALNGYIKLDGSSSATTGNILIGDTFGLIGVNGETLIFENSGVSISNSTGASFTLGSNVSLISPSDITIESTSGDIILNGPIAASSTIYINEVPVAPDPGFPPGSGGILYVENGILKFMGSTGTITPIALP